MTSQHIFTQNWSKVNKINIRFSCVHNELFVSVSIPRAQIFIWEGNQKYQNKIHISVSQNSSFVAFKWSEVNLIVKWDDEKNGSPVARGIYFEKFCHRQFCLTYLNFFQFFLFFIFFFSSDLYSKPILWDVFGRNNFISLKSFWNAFC